MESAVLKLKCIFILFYILSYILNQIRIGYLFPLWSNTAHNLIL